MDTKQSPPAGDPALTPSGKRKLRFGVMCEGLTLQSWMADCVRHLIASGLAEPALRIVDATPPRPTRWSRKTFLYDLYDLKWVRRRCPATRPENVARELGSAATIECRVETRGRYSQYFSKADVEAIVSHDLDFILRFGFNIIRGEILESARYGVWSYHHGNEQRYRGGPPCFWEIYHRDDTTGAILQRLTDRLDGGVVLHRGRFGTCKGSWIDNFDRALRGASDFGARVCADIDAGRLERVNGTPSDSKAPILRAPDHATFLRFAARMGGHVARKTWELMFHHDEWNVGVVEQSLRDVIAQGRITAPVTWVKPHARRHFLADPFPCEVDGRTELLVEDYQQCHKGKVSTLKPPFGPRSLNLTQGIERSEHLSYPCVFVDGGRTYCVPESFQAGRVILYERIDGSWQEVGTLIDGVKAVDPTLFKRDGLYWLFYTRQDDGAFGNQKLYAHHSTALREGWTPHRLNPLKCDITSSRPAGQVVEVDAKWYRPAQDCSRTYGGAVVINELVELSPDRFEERPIARLAPDPRGPYRDGLHTINAMGDKLVIDGKRFTFDASAWRQNWKRSREMFM